MESSPKTHEPTATATTSTEVVSEQELLNEKKIAEQERIRRCTMREARECTAFNYEHQIKTEGNKKTIYLQREKNDKINSAETVNSLMCATTGSANLEYANMMFSQIIASTFGETLNASSLASAINQVMISLAPKDEIEGMLISRLLILDNHIKEFTQRTARPDQTSDGIDININRVVKLTRLYNETLEALNKHRRKGEQKFTVQHVNVNNGGKAIVGNFDK